MPQIKHIVILKFKPAVDQETIETIFRQLADLQQKIEGIADYSGGTNNSPEGLNDGFTHGFTMTFTSAAARDAYLPHPEHEAVKALLVPCIERVMVFDYDC